MAVVALTSKNSCSSMSLIVVRGLVVAGLRAREDEQVQCRIHCRIQDQIWDRIQFQIESSKTFKTCGKIPNLIQCYRCHDPTDSESLNPQMVCFHQYMFGALEPVNLPKKSFMETMKERESQRSKFPVYTQLLFFVIVLAIVSIVSFVEIVRSIWFVLKFVFHLQCRST